MSYLHLGLRTHGSPLSTDKTWEAFLYSLDSLATEHEMHQDTSVQRPISQYIDKNGTNELSEF